MRFVGLPPHLREALEREAEDVPLGELISAARTLSERYRQGQPVRLQTHAARLAYALTRMPATLAAVVSCLREVPFVPHSLLDLGSGPGTVLWAFQMCWDRAPARSTAVELQQEWRHLAARLEAPSAEWRMADLRALPAIEPHDLTVCSYALNELNPAERIRLLDSSWTAASRALLLIEPGTAAGYGHIMEARSQLIGRGAYVGAPCPHESDCPLRKDDWCHFAVRVDRTRLHRLAKGGDLGFEDEKFSYVLLLKQPPSRRLPRILRHPDIQPGRITIQLCTDSGIAGLSASKSDKAAWKPARKASWGDIWYEWPTEH